MFLKIVMKNGKFRKFWHEFWELRESFLWLRRFHASIMSMTNFQQYCVPLTIKVQIGLKAVWFLRKWSQNINKTIVNFAAQWLAVEISDVEALRHGIHFALSLFLSISSVSEFWFFLTCCSFFRLFFVFLPCNTHFQPLSCKPWRLIASL